MYSAEELKELVEKSLKEIKFPDEPTELYSPIVYSLSLGAKRVRPILALMSCNVFTDRITDKHVLPALGIEVFHNFTLLHDDIMDKAETRRNQPSVYKKWNINAAILSGDAMNIEAYKLICCADKAKVLDILHSFNEAALDVCKGQQLDMNYETKTTITEEDYLAMVSQKTAALLAVSTKIGAIMGDASEANIERMYKLGVNLGIAFQIQDDILDVYSDSKKFGKEIGKDIENNKKTYLLTSAIRLAQGEQRKILRQIIENKQPVENKEEIIREIYSSLNIREMSVSKVEEYYSKAQAELNLIDVKPERKRDFQEFMAKLLGRSF